MSTISIVVKQNQRIISSYFRGIRIAAMLAF